MTAKVRTNVYLDSEMKAKAQEIFKTYGIGLSDAFNMFLSQSVLEKGIPFQIKIPNDETKQAIEDARNAKLNLTNSAKLFMYISLLLNSDELSSESLDHSLKTN